MPVAAAVAVDRTGSATLARDLFGRQLEHAPGRQRRQARHLDAARGNGLRGASGYSGARDPAAIDEHRFLAALESQRRHHVEARAPLEDLVVDEDLAVRHPLARGAHAPVEQRLGGVDRAR